MKNEPKAENRIRQESESAGIEKQSGQGSESAGIEKQSGQGSESAGIENRIKALLSDERLLEKYVYSDPEITGTVVRRYLLRLNGRRSVPTLGSGVGASALPPVKKPKTLSEAKAAADLMIRG